MVKHSGQTSQLLHRMFIGLVPFAYIFRLASWQTSPQVSWKDDHLAGLLLWLRSISCQHLSFSCSINSPSLNITRYVLQTLCTVTPSFFTSPLVFFNLTIKASLATPSLWVVLVSLRPLTGDQFDQEGLTQFTWTWSAHWGPIVSTKFHPPTHTICTSESNIAETNELSYTMFRSGTKKHMTKLEVLTKLCWVKICPSLNQLLNK